MDDRAALLHWLRLANSEKVGVRHGARLLAAFGMPANIFSSSPEALGAVVPAALVRALLKPPGHADAAMMERSLHWAAQPGRRILTLADADYPQALLTIPDPPLLLYAEGRLDLLQAQAVAIVGSRTASAQGCRHATQFGTVLADAGLCVVSGLALGIDAAAHMGGLAGRAGSIAVIGTGPDIDYPAANAALAARLRVEGCVLSEFAPGMEPLPANFPRRNRIISGLSRGVLVVEAAARSGSLLTARLAAEQGRDVYALPGSIHAPLARGCHALIKQGAKLVETAADVLDELGWEAAPAHQSSRQAAAPDTLLEMLGYDPQDFDTLALRCGLPAAELAPRLLELELAGRIEQLPGGRIQRID